MFCQKCGNEMPDDSAFCPKCAAPTGIGGSPEAAPITPAQYTQNEASKKKMKKGCLIALLIPAVLAVLFVVYCFVSVLFESDTESTTSVQTTAVTTSAVAVVEATTQPIVTQVPVTTNAPSTAAAVIQTIKISAEDLINAYDEDEAKADKLYKGKLLEVPGTIEVLGVDSSPPEIDISNGDPMSSYLVKCFITTGSVKNASALNPGDTVTVVGTCEGLDSDYLNIILSNSYIK